VSTESLIALHNDRKIVIFSSSLIFLLHVGRGFQSPAQVPKSPKHKGKCLKYISLSYSGQFLGHFWGHFGKNPLFNIFGGALRKVSFGDLHEF